MTMSHHLPAVPVLKFKMPKVIPLAVATVLIALLAFTAAKAPQPTGATLDWHGNSASVVIAR